MKLFIHSSPVGSVKVAIGASFIGSGLVGWFNPRCPGYPNPLLFVVSPVTIVPLEVSNKTSGDTKHFTRISNLII